MSGHDNQEYMSNYQTRLYAEELAYTSGPARGSRVIQVRNDKLRFEVLPDRGMGIGLLEYAGVPLSWTSSVGPIHSNRVEHPDDGWLRTFSGGALVTCGLTQVGRAAEDHGEHLGLHGRVANEAAYHVGVTDERHPDTAVTVRGTMRETRVFGEYLVLTRQIRTELGSRTITVEDSVTNAGYASSPFMILYHMNFGFPLVSPSARIVVPSSRTHPFDENARQFVQDWDVPTPPKPSIPERVYYHDVLSDAEGHAVAGIVNPELGLGIRLNWSTRSLPRLVQWNMFESGQYTTALEPGNCWTEGRPAERGRGTLATLEAGQTWVGGVSLTVLSQPQEIEALQQISGK